MCVIPPISHSSSTLSDFIVPLIAALIGGGFVLLGTWLQGRKAEQHAEKTRKRDLSVESARKVDIQLIELEYVLRDHTDHDLRTFDKAGFEKIASISTEMQLHRRYITDKRLQQSIHEATQFLRPATRFEDFANETFIEVTRNIVRWLAPMLQSHIMNEELPLEPSYVQTYRDAYDEAREIWNKFWLELEQGQTPNEQ